MSDEKKETTRALRVSIIKAPGDQGAQLLVSEARDADDLFVSGLGLSQKADVIRPIYDPVDLRKSVQNNNSLRQCIDAMEINIEGTGYVFKRKGEHERTDPKDASVAALNSFFSEPWPGESFTTQRRKFRRNLETVGYAFWEVIRNLRDEIVLVRTLDPDYIRLIRYDDPVPVDITIQRGGVESVISVPMRERRFIQKMGSKYTYFKEFGASRDLDKETAEWHEKGRLDWRRRATELIYRTVFVDADSPYGVPRWINQTPSILGSRKAEELNLRFFDNGGIPPAVIFVTGGVLEATSRKRLETVLGGGAAEKLQAAICEVVSTEGGMDSEASATVDVHEFTGASAQDSMFEGYDEKCETRVRSSFRLPPIFVGRIEGYTYSTAFASYTVGEAQIFGPERQESDEVQTNSLIKGLGFPDYRIESQPLTVSDTVVQLQALGMAEPKIGDQDFIDTLNRVANLSVDLDTAKVEEMKRLLTAGKSSEVNDTVEVTGDGEEMMNPKPKPRPTAKAFKPTDLVQLAKDYATMLSLRDGEVTDLRKAQIMKALREMGEEDRGWLDALMAAHAITKRDTDQTLDEAVAIAADVLTIEG